MGVDPAIETIATSVIDAAFDLHRSVGPGFLERIYQNGLAAELRDRDIPFAREAQASVIHKGRDIGTGRVDFLVDDRLVVELKAVDAIAPIHRAQTISYLNAMSLPLALLINFNVPKLKDGLNRVVETAT